MGLCNLIKQLNRGESGVINCNGWKCGISEWGWKESTSSTLFIHHINTLVYAICMCNITLSGISTVRGTVFCSKKFKLSQLCFYSWFWNLGHSDNTFLVLARKLSTIMWMLANAFRDLIASPAIMNGICTPWTPLQHKHRLRILFRVEHFHDNMLPFPLSFLSGLLKWFSLWFPLQ